MQNRRLQCVIILFIIASSLICLACNASDSNRFYFATSFNGESSLNAQYLASTNSFHLDFAGEETLHSASSSYSNLSYSIVRSHRNVYSFVFILMACLLNSILILSGTLCSYGYQFLQKQSFSSVRIAKFIEHSDGKK